MPPLPMTAEVAEDYGMIRAKLEKLGKRIGSNDLWIAAHALMLDLILITNNVKEFSRILQLRRENWVIPSS